MSIGTQGALRRKPKNPDTFFERTKIPMEYNTTARIEPPDILSLSAYWLFGLIGCPANGMIIYLSLAKKVEYQSYTGFIVNMALADFIMELIGDVLLQAWTVFQREHYGWEPVCIWAGFIAWLGAIVSFFNLPLLSFNRFIVFYFRDLEGVLYTKHGVLIQAGGAWVMTAVILGIFTATGFMGWQETGCRLCGPIIDVYRSPIWLILFFYLCIGGTFVIFYIIVVVSNVKVYEKMKEHTKESGSDKASKSRQESTKHVLKLTAIMCTLPLFFEVPVVLFYPILNGTYMVGPIFGVMIHFNSVINPYLTIFFMKPYLRAVKGIFGCGKSSAVGATTTALSSVHHASTVHKPATVDEADY